MYQKTVLENGIRVVTHDMKQRESIALGFWIGVGGRYEQDRIKGAAHFLEHIVFKGSQKYSCSEIKELIEGVGGSLNAFTSEEQTCFYAKIPSKHLEQTFDVLADMVFSPNISSEDVFKEGAVIIEEIKMYRDQPQCYVLELLDELLWPAHPLGKNLAGTPETISRMTDQDLHGFHQTHYIPKGIVISLAGDVEHEKIVKLAKKKLNRIPSKDSVKYIAADNSQNEPRARFYFKEIEQIHLALGMFGFDENHKDRYVLSILNTILGGNMSSRLFNELREKRGLAYSISSYAKTLQDTGIFCVRAGVETKKVVDTVELILVELNKMKKEGVTSSEFTRAKDYLLGQLLLGLEDTLDHMLWIGESVISKNKVKTRQSIIKEFGKIKKEDVQRVAQEILKENRFNLSVVGPLTEDHKTRLRQLLGVAL